MKSLLIAVLTIFSLNAQAYFTMSSYSVDFWDVKVGDVFGKEKTIYIYNRDNKNINVTSYDTCFIDVRVRTRFCYNLTPGMSCDLEVTFTPKAPGNLSCTVTAYDDAGHRELIHVSGNAVQ